MKKFYFIFILFYRISTLIFCLFTIISRAGFIMNENKNLSEENIEVDDKNSEQKVSEARKDYVADIIEEISINKESTEDASDEIEKQEHPYFNNQLTLEEFTKVIESKNITALSKIEEDNNEVLLGDLLTEMSDTDIVLFFKLSRSAKSALIFSYLSPEHKEKIIEAFTNEQIQSLVSKMATDDLVDFVDDLPSNLVQKVLQSTSKENRKKINAFLQFEDGTAGSIMTTEYVELSSNMTVLQAFDKVREVGKKAETIQKLFVIDSSRILIGVVNLDTLIFAKPTEKIEDIMLTDYAYALTATDQEEVSNLFKKYDLSVLPITNTEKRILGIITVDDILDVVEEENTEDMNKIAGISGKENKPYFQTTILQSTKKCFPWLMFLLVVGTLTSLVLNQFEASLSVVPVLTVFIPTLMGTSGNSGNQTTTVITRALSLKEIQPKSWYKVLGKEAVTGLLIGLIVGIFTFCWTLIEFYANIIQIEAGDTLGMNMDLYRVMIASVVGLCVFFAIFFSRVIGSILPIVAKLCHLDPAVMAGPLITTILDTSSLLIYLGLAELIIMPLV